MANEHQSTDIELVLYRGRVIFFVLFSLCIATLASALYTGLESGEIQKKITSAQKQWRDFQKSLEPLPTQTPIIIKTYPTPTEEPTPTTIPVKQESVYYYYTYPTSKPYPTIVPGQPGSKEWEEEFQRKWNSYSSGSTTSTYSFPTPKPGDLGSQEWKDNFDKQFNETKAKIEAGQKEFCEKNPSLSFCK